MSQNKIILDVSPILNSEIGESLKFAINQPIADPDKEVKIAGKVAGSVVFNHLEKNSLLGLFNLKFELELECARCLKSFNKKFNLTYEQEFSTQKLQEDVFPISPNQTVDLYPSIRQEILLTLPLKPLCRKSCEGIKV